jgi:presenilin-like A22 family membrane protease
MGAPLAFVMGALVVCVVLLLCAPAVMRHVDALYRQEAAARMAQVLAAVSSPVVLVTPAAYFAVVAEQVAARERAEVVDALLGAETAPEPLSDS